MRIWDIDTSDNFLLPISISNGAAAATQSQIVAPNLTGGGGGNGTLSSSSPPASSSSTSATTKMEVFTCIAYCTDNQTLCAGTNQGNLYTWKRTNYSVDVPENTWQLNNISAVRGAIKQCTWGVCDAAKSCIMLNCVANVYILKVSIYLISYVLQAFYLYICVIWHYSFTIHEISLINFILISSHIC